MIKFSEFIIIYDNLTKERNKERALWNALMAEWTKVQPLFDEDIDYFHKAFRQMDVTKTGYMDMVIWILLDEAELFWELIEKHNIEVPDET